MATMEDEKPIIQAESDDDVCKEDLILDEIKNIDMSKLPPAVQEDINLQKNAEIYQNANSISVLVTGKTGTGKSTLANGILGVKVVAREEESIQKPGTREVEPYTTTIHNVRVTVWDSPGLQDSSEIQESYVQQMKTECSQRDLTMYCISVKDTRFFPGDDNPDVVAMKKLTNAFGVEFWENAVIVLTFANVLEALHVDWDDLSQQDKATAFKKVIQEWKEQIQKILVLDNVPKEIVDKIPVVPAGHYKKPALPDCDYWLSNLWFFCLSAVPTDEAKAALIKMNKKRLKQINEVKIEDFKKEAENQPIVVPTSTNFHSQYSRPGMKLGGLIGFGLGLLGGPFAFLTVPVGIIIGMGIGGTVGTAVEMGGFK